MDKVKNMSKLDDDYDYAYKLLLETYLNYYYQINPNEALLMYKNAKISLDLWYEFKKYKIMVESS